MSATIEMMSTPMDRREQLIAKLAPLGVSFGYQNTRGDWVETATETLERVAPSFDREPDAMTAPPLVCTPGRWHPELFGTLILEDGIHFQCHGVVDVPGYHILYTRDGVRRFVIAAPEHLRTPERGWGWQIQLYATRSAARGASATSATWP